MKIREVLEKFLKGLDSIEILSDSFLTAKTDSEREIGVVTEEETKKLYYYVSYLFDRNMRKFIQKENLLLGLEEKNPGTKKEELRKLRKEIRRFLGLQVSALFFLSEIIDDIVELPESCEYFFIRKGWKIVVPNDCGICKVRDACFKNDNNYSIEAIKNNHRYN